ncbi:protein kinase domain-containing protein [Nonomuraea soli]|uniref:non-specific serine/threonine protein kinase n=1 Tax=Nonomuraea soli TaxID=1032476 RepID=A0A7W0CI28_9ACTN|nr:protein kinase [Nonomuraea soli]MBA2891513.1 serine/threonine-protein kinase [Nonomuraea soli]
MLPPDQPAEAAGRGPGLEAGSLLARRYLLLEPLAEGGMSVIWRAFDQSLSRLVAVKVHSLPLRGGPEARDRTRSEARVTAHIGHPGVVDVYDYGESITSRGDIAAYVVMRLLDGVPLAERICDGPMPWEEAVEIGRRVALVLQATHELGVVHMDVSAENILLTPDGPKLLDFGIAARIGDPDHGSGTPPFVAPERIGAAPAHPAVDVYALGVLLYAMLTGTTPYPETTWEELQEVRRAGKPPKPSGAPWALARLVRRCLAAEPAARPSAADAARALVYRPGRRTGLLVAASMACAVVVAAEITALLPGSPSPTQERPGTAAHPAVTVNPERTPEHTPQHTPSPSLPQRSAPVSTPAPARTVRPSTIPTPSRRADTVVTAVQAFHEVLAKSGIRADVALDLRQVLQNLLSTPRPTEEQVAGMRQKLADREREGGLPSSYRVELEIQLTRIASAMLEKT